MVLSSREDEAGKVQALDLGADDHGRWLGVPSGTRFTRPGAEYVSPTDQVVLVPADAWVATFHAPGGPVGLYVDITTPAVWHPGPRGTRRLIAIDLDLDVVRGTTGRVWIDDEDEFADHRVSLGYPDEIAALLQVEHVEAHRTTGVTRPQEVGVHAVRRAPRRRQTGRQQRLGRDVPAEDVVGRRGQLLAEEGPGVEPGQGHRGEHVAERGRHGRHPAPRSPGLRAEDRFTARPTW